MPSNSLATWAGTRQRCLDAIDAQCAASLAASPGNPLLAEENVRGYGLLLSAHFQGFYRDLYTEAALLIASKVRPALRLVVQEAFTFRSALDYGNPTYDNIKVNFGRLGSPVNLVESDPANLARLGHLSSLNRWRNIAAHHGKVSPGGTPELADLRAWRRSCDGLAASLDAIVYNQSKALLRRKPWTT